MRRLPIILIVLVVLLVAARLALPSLLLRHVNKTLDEIPGYSGHVDDIHVSLWRGAYQIKGLKLEKTGGKVPVPLFSSPDIDLSIQWKALFNGALVGEIMMHHPELNFVAAPDKSREQLGASSRWQDSVRSLFPLRINKLTVTDGELHFRNFHSDPKVDIQLDSIEGVATNLTNSEKLSETLSATVEATARAEKEAPVKITVKFDPYATTPTFDLDVSMKELSLVKLNDFLLAYGNFDVEKGKFSIFTEIASSNKAFKGYVKPFLKDVHAVSLSKDSDNPLRLAWEAAVALVLDLVKDRESDRVASKITLSGKYKDPHIGLFDAITSLLSNAFIRALIPEIERTIEEGDVAIPEKKE